MASNLLRGLVLGFAIAASPGPIFFLCLRRTLARGWLRGAVAGLGVATGDGTYAALAAFGVAAVSNVLVAQRRWLDLIGGVVLLGLGLRAVVARPASQEPQPAPAAGGLAANYVSIVALTLTNPATIIAFAAVFAGLGLASAGSVLAAMFLVAGVLIGSAAWWVVLATVAALARARLTPAVVEGISIASGLAVAAFGGLAILSAVGRV
jgi:threonine/homoserine/homoserine lactone efflux protein